MAVGSRMPEWLKEWCLFFSREINNNQYTLYWLGVLALGESVEGGVCVYGQSARGGGGVLSPRYFFDISQCACSAKIMGWEGGGGGGENWSWGGGAGVGGGRSFSQSTSWILVSIKVQRKLGGKGGRGDHIPNLLLWYLSLKVFVSMHGICVLVRKGGPTYQLIDFYRGLLGIKVQLLILIVWLFFFHYKMAIQKVTAHQILVSWVESAFFREGCCIVVLVIIWIVRLASLTCILVSRPPSVVAVAL
jgi:hypothetical protein